MTKSPVDTKSEKNEHCSLIARSIVWFVKIEASSDHLDGGVVGSCARDSDPRDRYRDGCRTEFSGGLKLQAMFRTRGPRLSKARTVRMARPGSARGIVILLRLACRAVVFSVLFPQFNIDPLPSCRYFQEAIATLYDDIATRIEYKTKAADPSIFGRRSYAN